MEHYKTNTKEGSPKGHDSSNPTRKRYSVTVSVIIIFLVVLVVVKLLLFTIQAIFKTGIGVV